METTLFCSALVLAGAFLIAAGCAVMVGRWLDQTFFKRRMPYSPKNPKQDKEPQVDADPIGAAGGSTADSSI